MEWITVDSVIRCGHDGTIRNRPSQEWVRIGRHPGGTDPRHGDRDTWPLVLVDDDPTGRDIVACPNYGANIKPCTTTLRVATGYSDWIRVDGKRIVLSHLDGLTDGTPPGTVHYDVRDPAQHFVRADR